MSKDKKVNYTEEQATHLVAEYSKGESDEERAQIMENLSRETGRNVKSIRAKLVREGVYIAKTYKPKTGGKVETKDAIVDSIAIILGVEKADLTGLNKATKNALNLLRDRFKLAE